MKHFNLLLTALLTVGLSGFVFTHAGWLCNKKPSPAAARRDQPRLHARTDDSLASDAGRRWRNCQAPHWRAFMLQR
jgi:hypothetical protein